jgi:ubiquinone biosynthesis protein
MEVQPQLVLLQKTLLYIEGLGRQLYPQLDLWQTAQPFLRQWVSEQYGPQAVWSKIKHKWPIWMEQLPEIPEQLASFLHQSQTTKDQLKQLTKQLEQLSQQQKKRRRLTVFLAIGVSITLFSGFLLNTGFIDGAGLSLIAAGVAFILAIRNS